MGGTKQPKSVQVVVSRERNGSREYLLLLRHRPGTDDFWQPVSGSLEPGESFADAAARELAEETGLTPRSPIVDLGLVNRFRIAPAWLDLYPDSVTHNVQAAFATTAGLDDVRIDPSEHVAFRWVSHAEARELLRYESNRRAIDLVAAGHDPRRRRRFELRVGSQTLALGERTLVMGILNVTPDSFSDGGFHADPDVAIDRALEMVADGAEVIDVGGESSRPGAAPVSADEEQTRVVPVIRELARQSNVLISVDTVRASTAAAAVDAGAQIVNDISGLGHDPEMADTVARAGAALVLMHMRGNPATMQKLPPLDDVLADIEIRLLEAIETAVDAGIPEQSLVLDPGIGFGKTGEQNVEILARLDRVAALDRPVLVGTSRKSFLGALTHRGIDERQAASVASVAVAVLRGAHVVRVHDVAQAVDAVRVADAVAARAFL